MEIQNYNQDIISTSSSDITPNYPNTNNPSFPENKYPEAQFQTPQQYNPPPSEQQNYQTQNNGYSSHPQNQSGMPILPESQYPPQNSVQTITPIFQLPLVVDQNISQVNHNRISQPSKNVFKILRQKCYIMKLLLFILVGSFFAFLGFIFFIRDSDGQRVGWVFFIILGSVFTVLGIISFFLTNYKVDIFLGDNNLTVVKKALCCGIKVTKNYQKIDLSGIEFTCKKKERYYSRGGPTIVNKYELIFNFKNGQRERILKDEDPSEIYSYEEMEFLENYINYYINRE